MRTWKVIVRIAGGEPVVAPTWDSREPIEVVHEPWKH
jgi:hypothetical protein